MQDPIMEVNVYHLPASIDPPLLSAFLVPHLALPCPPPVLFQEGTYIGITRTILGTAYKYVARSDHFTPVSRYVLSSAEPQHSGNRPRPTQK